MNNVVTNEELLKRSSKQRSYSHEWENCSNALLTQREGVEELRLLGNEFHRNRIHAVPGILWSKPLAEDDVSEVSAAGSTLFLCPHAIIISNSLDSAIDFIVISRPAAFSV